jgi:hypothetical protein
MKALALSRDDLNFLRWTFDLFPNAESPLAFVAAAPDPVAPAEQAASLRGRGLLSADGSGASDEVRQQLQPVAECAGRVVVRHGTGAGGTCRNYYVAARSVVEYTADGDQHRFGPVRNESALAVDLAREFAVATAPRMRPVQLSSAEYLVFAVLARDLRGRSQNTETMSISEVLAHFDDGGGGSDVLWQESLQTLYERAVLVRAANGYELEGSYHPLAREIAADRQHTVMRLDYLEQEWLVREVDLYPTDSRVFSVGIRPDGAVSIAELSGTELADVVAGVVTTLPDLVHPQVVSHLQPPR